MSITATAVVPAIAALHGYILVLEMFLWTHPRTRVAFGTTQAFAEETKALAANQGLYNGFLAAGLVWGPWRPTPWASRRRCSS
jgi:putative membrane protein